MLAKAKMLGSWSESKGLLEAEKHQSDALAIIRSLKFSSDFRVNQIFFNRDISRRGGEFNENIFFGILLGRGKILAPPLDVFNGDLSNLHTIISKLCPPTSNVASVSQGNRPILHVHSSNAMSSRFSYFGEKKSIEQFKAKLAKEHKFVVQNHAALEPKVTGGESDDFVQNKENDEVPLSEVKYGVDSGERESEEVIPSSINEVPSKVKDISNVYDYDESDIIQNNERRTTLKSYSGEMVELDKQLDESSSNVSEEETCGSSPSLLNRTSSTSNIFY